MLPVQTFFSGRLEAANLGAKSRFPKYVLNFLSAECIRCQERTCAKCCLDSETLDIFPRTILRTVVFCGARFLKRFSHAVTVCVKPIFVAIQTHIECNTCIKIKKKITFCLLYIHCRMKYRTSNRIQFSSNHFTQKIFACQFTSEVWRGGTFERLRSSPLT